MIGGGAMSSQPGPEDAEQGRLVSLMIAYQAGDLAAFEALYGLLVEDLRRHVGRIERERGLAHDLVQEVFLEMHRSRRTYTPPLPVRPWVFGIARHVVARSRRASRREALVGLDGDADAVAGVAAPPRDVPSPESLDVSSALAALPAASRDAWLLHHGLGWSFSSIAERLGVSVMAAKLRSSRATRALRAALGIGRRRDGDA